MIIQSFTTTFSVDQTPKQVLNAISSSRAALQSSATNSPTGTRTSRQLLERMGFLYQRQPEELDYDRQRRPEQEGTLSKTPDYGKMVGVSDSNNLAFTDEFPLPPRFHQ